MSAVAPASSSSTPSSLTVPPALISTVPSAAVTSIKTTASASSKAISPTFVVDTSKLPAAVPIRGPATTPIPSWAVSVTTFPLTALSPPTASTMAPVLAVMLASLLLPALTTSTSILPTLTVTAMLLVPSSTPEVFIELSVLVLPACNVNPPSFVTTLTTSIPLLSVITTSPEPLVFTESSPASVSSAPPDPPTPILPPAARVTCPPAPVSIFSSPVSPASSILPDTTLILIALALVSLVTSLPKVTSPCPLMSIIPPPVLPNTVPSASVISPCPLAPAFTSISPLPLVVTSPAAVNTTSLPAELNVTCPFTAPIVL